MNGEHTLNKGKNFLNTKKNSRNGDTKDTIEEMQTKFVKTHQKIERCQGCSDYHFEATVRRGVGEKKLQQEKDFVK